ncbi:uncharacterized protein DDB_G0271670-like isoform X3 [Lethenteron reissneri]|uniref:uncharacterized protein DDB_G0271670-like isoform X3 n=1 Tax=Lethenteron reissneri TaxID=7753 RepID=UPI002AB6D32C|nr:uncharacterized protein DDB_G0271670-like isoform X3 [Lethenteron reissneri]
MDPIIAEGPVRVRDTKKWKSRWVVLSKPSPVADCLMLLAFKSRSERLKGARPRTCARLQDVCAVSTGLTLHSAAHVLAVSCPSLCLLLAFERRDVMSAWDARLRYSLGEDLGGGGESRRSDSVNKETQELEMRLSLLSLASGDGSPASSLPSSSPLSSQPSLSEGRSTPSGLSDDASLPPAGSALSISTTTTTSSSSSSSYGEPRRAIAARPCAAADRDRAAGNPAGGRSQNDAAGASRLSRAQQLSSLESGIGSGSLDSSSRGSVASSSSSGSRCVAGAPRHPSPRPDASAGGNAAATSVDALVGDGIDGGGGAAGERSRGGGERDDGADERATLRDRDSPRDPTYSSPRPLVGQGCSCLRCCASAVAATASAAAAAASDDKSSTRHRCRADADRARPFLRRQPLAASSSLDVPPREAADSESPRAAAMLQTRSLSHDVPQSKMSAEEFDWLSLLANQEVRRGLEPRGVVGGGRAATLPSDGGAGDRSAARAAPGPYLTFEQWRRATLEPQRRPQRDDETGSVPSPLRIVERSVDPGDLQETNAGLRDAGLRDAGLRGAGAQGSDRASTLTPVTRL